MTNEQKTENHELLTIEELATYLRISPRSIYNKVRPGHSGKPFPIKPVRIGKLIRFRRSELENL